MFNSLPSNIKNFSNNQKKFKTALKMSYIQIPFIHLIILMLIKEKHSQLIILYMIMYQISLHILITP
jgi:hypothetical protein